MQASRCTDRQIIAVLKEAEAGTPVPALCRTHGISNATFYKWRSTYGGMDASLMSRLKELDDENRRLNKRYVAAQLSADLLREALAKQWYRQRSAGRWPQRGHPAGSATDWRWRWICPCRRPVWCARWISSSHGAGRRFGFGAITARRT